MELNLRNKLAIVTGGARGLGESFVQGFVREKANVVIGDVLIDEAKAMAAKLTNAEVKVIAVKADVSRKADTDNLIATALAEFSKIDILVNAAGVVGDFDFVDLEEAEWDRIMDINAKGTYLMAKAAVPYMISQGYGKLINISSRAGKQGAPTNAHYSASKFAVVGLTQSLAKALAIHNINVNAICPGIIRTYQWEVILEARSKRTGIPKEELFSQTVKEVTPLGRPVEPLDIANMVLFLSSEVSRNITGETVNVNGGSYMD